MTTPLMKTATMPSASGGIKLTKKALWYRGLFLLIITYILRQQEGNKTLRNVTTVLVRTSIRENIKLKELAVSQLFLSVPPTRKTPKGLFNLQPIPINNALPSILHLLCGFSPGSIIGFSTIILNPNSQNSY